MDYGENYHKDSVPRPPIEGDSRLSKWIVLWGTIENYEQTETINSEQIRVLCQLDECSFLIAFFLHQILTFDLVNLDNLDNRRAISGGEAPCTCIIWKHA